jgi:hypothetical protein
VGKVPWRVDLSPRMNAPDTYRLASDTWDLEGADKFVTCRTMLKAEAEVLTACDIVRFEQRKERFLEDVWIW